MRWLVRAPAIPRALFVVADEREAIELVRTLRARTRGHRTKVVWEYGTQDPSEPRSYRRVGPRPTAHGGTRPFPPQARRRDLGAATEREEGADV